MDCYEKLRQRMDLSIPIPTPATESKVEIEILRRLITPDEAEIACHLSARPEDVATIANRAGKGVEKVETALEEMVKK